MKYYLREFIIFGIKQVRACIFAGSFFVVLFLSNYLPLFGIPRYDFLFLAALLIQLVLALTKIETMNELKTIFLFHLIGLALEIFKTHPSIGSWTYPEFGYFKVFNVPLYSGFMYAAVGSYISQAWRIFDLKLAGLPPYRSSSTLGLLIYINFFTHHFIPDFRYILMLSVLILFRKTWVSFKVTERVWRMPLVFSFVLIAFFIWVAENISTFYGAWSYPDQSLEWSIVSFHKVGAWSLLVIISFVLVANLKHSKKIINV